MTRQIKFRAWNGKTMINTGTINETTRESGYEMWDGDTHEYYPVMQFTGLLDKNGKEIYEGDVVKSHVITFDANDPARIDQEWDELGEVVFEGLRIIIQNKKHGNYHNFRPQTEIIGNIYENPDLLIPHD